jgi:hypothetical protein
MQRVMLVATIVASGCAWDLHARPAREGEPLVLPTMGVRLPPPSKGWSVARRFDTAEYGYSARAFVVSHADAEGKEDERVVIGEVDDAFAPESGAGERATLVARASSLAGDPSAEIVDLPLAPVERLGAGARQIALRATARAGDAGEEPGRRVGWAFSLVFAPPGTSGRTVVVMYEARAGRAAPPPPVEERWRQLVAAIEPRAADAASVREAARGGSDFPKQLEAGLARRSLTLPRGAVQWSLTRERWLAPQGFDGSWGLSVGLSDRLQLSAPGYLRYAFGEAEALTRPEVAVGLGWLGFQHDAVAGSTWGFGASAQGRRRLGADVAARASLLLAWTHESRTGVDVLGGSAGGGVIWDVHRWVSLGLEAGHARSTRDQPFLHGDTRALTWLGGRQTPLVTVHVPPLDVGLDGAVAWDGREPGVLAGFTVRLTL